LEITEAIVQELIKPLSSSDVAHPSTCSLTAVCLIHDLTWQNFPSGLSWTPPFHHLSHLHPWVQVPP